MIQPLRTLLLLLALVAPAIAGAVQLNDVRPDRLAAFVQADRVTVVLFTSPDEKCGYCVGQLNVFNTAAVHYRNEPPVFGYVQWKPWRDFPKMDLPRPIYGIPHLKIFRKGEVLGEIDGRFTDPAKLIALVDDALAGKLKPMPHVAPPPSEPDAASAPAAPPRATAAPAEKAEMLSDGDRAAVSLFLRQELLTTLTRSCAKKHPSQASAAQEAEAVWKQRHGKDADRGMMVVMGSSSNAALRALISPMGKAQAAELDTRLPMNKELPAGDCERVYGFMGKDVGVGARR